MRALRKTAPLPLAASVSLLRLTFPARRPIAPACVCVDETFRATPIASRTQPRRTAQVIPQVSAEISHAVAATHTEEQTEAAERQDGATRFWDGSPKTRREIAAAR